MAKTNHFGLQRFILNDASFSLANVFQYKEISKMPGGDGIYTIDLKQSKMIDYKDFNIETNEVSVANWHSRLRFKHS